MATVNKPGDSQITSDAYDLLDCFVSGLDDVIYEIAESLAEQNKRTSPGGVTEISADEVKKAAKIVFDAIESQIGKSIPREVAGEFRRMHDCVMKKCDILQ